MDSSIRLPELRNIRSFDGCRLSVFLQGDVELPPVLFIHSIGLDHSMWDGQVDALARRNRIIRYDSRGHGKSDVPRGEYSIEMLGQDALAVLDAAGLERASVVGSSIGGMTALWLAARHPARVRQLVLANTTAHIGRPEMWNERIRQVRDGGMAAVAEATAARWLSSAFKDQRPREAQHFVDRLSATSPAGFSGMCAVLRDVDLRDSLKQIEVPTLVIGAGGSGPEASAAARLADAITGSRFCRVPQGGHLSNLESPDAFNAALIQFLDNDFSQE